MFSHPSLEAEHFPKPLIVVAGPTGSGKSSLALDLAEQNNGEILNCDSVQIYRGFDIGSAKLPAAQRRNIPHHLLDIAGPNDDFTAGDYSRAARKVLSEISRRAATPILCGGTGFYLRALLMGLSPAPPRHDRLRGRLTRIAQRRPSALHSLLKRWDEPAARRIHPNDLQKLIRALEMSVLEKTGASQVQSRPRDALQGYRVLKLGLHPARQQLYETLNRRSTELFANGLLQETEQLLTAGYPIEAKPMQSLGYRQAINVISGRQSLSDAITELQIKTRQYAKRQITWFRAEPDIHWLPGFGADPAVREEALRLTENFLQQHPSAPL